MLKNIYLIINIPLLLIAFSCPAMNKQQNILDTLIPKDAYAYPKIEFITDDCVLLNLHYMGIHRGCYMVDLKKNNLIKKIEFDKPFKKGHCCSLATLSMHPNKKLFSLFKYKNILLYNATTGDLQKHASIDCNPEKWSFTMHPTNNTILFWNIHNDSAIGWDYSSNTIENRIFDHTMNIIQIECHPKEQELCIINQFTGTMIFNSIMPDQIIEPQKTTHPYSQYSPNGLLIACCKNHSISQKINIITTSINHATKCCYLPEKGDEIDAIEFHPNNRFLAISLTPNRRIEYFDIEEKQVIAHSKTNSRELYNYGNRIRFSPNGTKVAFTCKHDYYMIDVPLEVIYQPKTKNFLPHLLFLLKNYRVDAYNPLPQDIVYLLAHTTLETLKY